MTLQINKTKGITCKACDRSLDTTECDGELCSTCLGVVHELNKDVYLDNDVSEE